MSKSKRIRTGRTRPTIGLLTHGLVNANDRALWLGVADAAREYDANLVCFPGRLLHSPHGFESQGNILYELVSAENVDGLLIWSMALSIFVGPEAMGDFCRRYHPLPMVSVGLTLESIPRVLADSYHGMYDAMMHLIRVHGYHRIAFICGPEGHQDAEERYRAYDNALAEHGLSVDPDLVMHGDFSSPASHLAGAEAVRLLFDQRRLRPQTDLEAIVAANDHMALGALEALQARGIRVPGDVAVVGFDDVDEGKYVTPPLTTVPQPLYEMGKQAVGMLLARMKDEQTPWEVTLSTKAVIRQSCGCLAPTVVRAAVGPTGVAGKPLRAVGPMRRRHIVAEMVQAVESSSIGPLLEWAGQLLDAFVVEIEGGPSGGFLLVLDDVLRETTMTGGDVAVWQEALSALRRCIFTSIAPGEPALRAEDLWQQARVMIGEVARRVQAHQNLMAARQAQALSETGQVLIAAFDATELMDVVARELPRLGIPSCYLSLFDSPQTPAGWSRLILAFDERGRVALPPRGRRFRSRHLVAGGLSRYGRRRVLVVESLYFREDQFGFVVFEMGPQDGIVYETLRGQISSALKGALLFMHNADLYNQALEARTVAEKADRLKTRLLANVSHELRTPLNVIRGYARAALNSPNPYGVDLDPALLRDLEHIHRSAEHQLRVVNDLLNLSRAEVGELDLYLEFLEPRPLLEEVFHSMAGSVDCQSEVAWRLELPDRLPMVQVDPVRLRQILLNLLSNAAKFVERGEIVLGAEVAPPHLHIWVRDTGVGIPLDQQERIFEPFVTAENTLRRLEGIGLGLSITRRLVALHRGLMRLESEPGQGSTFHVYLPLPSLSDQPASIPESAQAVLLLVSAQGYAAHIEPMAADIVEFSRRQGLEIRRIGIGDDVDRLLAEVQPAALALDLVGANPDDWTIVQRLRKHPRLSQVPFVLYGQENACGTTPTIGMTSMIVKPASATSLVQAFNALRPPGATGPVLIVDDDPQAREYYQSIVAQALPGHSIRTAEDGIAALRIMARETPSLVILDLMMPEMDGFEVVEWMRADQQFQRVPILILSNRMLTSDDIKRLEQHTQVTFQSKGVLSEREAEAFLRQAMFSVDALPPHTSALVKRSVAYLLQNYQRSFSRQEIARAIGVTESYLTRIFHEELGLTPWEYLSRYRIRQAKELLRCTNDSITAVALQVGFSDSAYFTRVFHRMVGLSPSAYRRNPE